MARRKVLESDGICSHAAPTTIIEFNLFGDPSLHLYGAEASLKVFRTSMKESLYRSSDVPVKVNAHKVFSSSAMSGGILSRIRLQVDANFRQIRHMIEEHLYSMYNIRPKGLNSVYCCKSPTDEAYSYIFAGENGDVIVVELDRHNKIKKVLTEK